MPEEDKPIFEKTVVPEPDGPVKEEAGVSGNGTGPAEAAGNGSMPLAGRLLATGTRGVQRVAGATGLDRTLETAAEEAIVRAVESEATERAIARIINGPTIEAAVQEALRSEAVKQSVLDTIDSELVDQVWARLLESDETELLIKRIAEAPEVRSAIASQGVGLVDDLGRQIRGVTRILDGLTQRLARRILFRKAVPAVTDRVGAVTRVLALTLDAFIINVSLLAISAGLSALLGLFGYSGDGSPAALALGATTWFFVSSLYLFTFWALSGQTPGMRFLDIRIEADGEHRIGARHAFRRLVGFWLSVIPFMLGFIGVLVKQNRRGFHDRLGGTSVFYIDATKPGAPHEFVDPERN